MDLDGDGPSGEALVAGGNFSSMSGVSGTAYISWWDNAQWRSFGSGMNNSVAAVVAWNSGEESTVPVRLVAGGYFTMAGSTAANHVALWDGTAWQALGSGLSATVEALTTWDPDGGGPQPEHLIAGGDFGSAGGVAASKIARWDGSSWYPIGTGLSGGRVYAVTNWDPDGLGATPPFLVAAGSFGSAGGISDTVRIAAWNGDTWQPFGTGFSGGPAFALASVDSDGNSATADSLVAAGAFVQAGGTEGTANIASWNGSQWEPLGTGVSGECDDVIAWNACDRAGSSPLVLVGGSFSHAGGSEVNRVAAWDGAVWHPMTPVLQQPRIFVNRAATGSGDGSSWPNAFKYLQDAISAAAGAPCVLEIWVAQDTYHPDETAAAPNGTGDRAASFNLIDGVAIYGGFAGTESELSQRNIAAHPTILSGDLGQLDPVATDNAYQVVVCDIAGPTAILDGFIIRDGYADSANGGERRGAGMRVVNASPTVRNCTFTENHAGSAGGGLCIEGSGEPTFSACRFVLNTAGEGGGIALFEHQNAPRFSQCLIARNQACSGGGVRLTNGGSPTPGGAFLHNCTVTENPCGGAISLYVSNSINLDSCIVYGNDGPLAGAAIADSPSRATVAYSLLQDNVYPPDNIPFTGIGNLELDPMLQAAAGLDGIPGTYDDDFVLERASPCVDSGSGASDSAAELFDLRGPGYIRTVDGDGDAMPEIDMGAFEWSETCPACPGARIWANPAGGTFSVHANWDLSAPSSSNDARLVIPAAYGVDFTEAAFSRRLIVEGGDVGFDLAGRTYRLSSTSPFGGLVVADGPSQVSRLMLFGGGLLALQTGGVSRIGSDETADGSLTVTDAGTSLFAGTDLCVGCAGTGSLSVLAGGQATSFVAAVGDLPGAIGSAVVSGAGSLWEVPFFMTIGSGDVVGSGVVTVADQGVLSVGPGGILVLQNGTLAGNGVVLGDVTTIGAVRPGPDQDMLAINGRYEQLSAIPGFGEISGSLRVTVGDANGYVSADHLAVSGLATLGGGLIVERAANFEGPLPQDVEVLSASSINGFFDVAFLPHAGDSQRYLSAQTQAGLRGVGQSVVITSLPLTDFINTDSASPTGLNGTPSAAATGDLDGDGDLDVAAVVPRLDGNSQPINGDVVILRNEGLSMGAWQGFAAVQLTGVTGRDPRGIAAADLDGQPGLDLVIADAADDTVSVLLNTGTGAFQPRTTFSVGDEPRAVVAADLDADGYFDVATANTSGGSVSVLRNQEAEEPGGTWAGLGQTLGDQRVDVPVEPSHADPRPVALAAVQLNSDAGEELAVANEGASSIAVLRNDPSLRSWFARWYLPPVRLPTPRPPTSIEPENMDEDKWDDIVYASATGGTAGIILNDRQTGEGAGTIRFRPAVEVPIGSNPTSIVGADLDQDLDIDLAIATTDESSARIVRVLRNDAPINGVVTLSPDQDISAGADPRIVLAGNVDGVEGEPNPSDDLIVLGVGVIASRASKDAGGFGMLTGVPQPDGARVFRNIPPKSPTPPCAGDANGDNAVNFADITSVVVNWGTSGPPGGAPLPGDADHSGSVNFADITAVLVEWGAVCG